MKQVRSRRKKFGMIYEVELFRILLSKIVLFCTPLFYRPTHRCNHSTQQQPVCGFESDTFSYAK